MPTLATFTVFLLAGLGILLTPGPAVLYIIARSVDQGRKAGMVSVLGIASGSLVHIAAAALGLSVLLVTSALAFTVVKYLGAAYLIYLGLRTLFKRDTAQEMEAVQPRKLSRVFFQGTLVQILSPKATLFFFAFLPQFVDPARGSITEQILILGTAFALLALCSDSMYALLAGTAGKWLKNSAHFRRIQRYVTGIVYIGLGIFAAFAHVDKK